VTEVMLLLLAGGLLQSGIDKLIGMNWLPPIINTVWDTSAVLDDSSPVGSFIATLTGYRATPSLLNVLVLAVFWLAVWFLLRRASKPAAASAPAQTVLA
jgi:high-affinity iron transporter